VADSENALSLRVKASGDPADLRVLYQTVQNSPSDCDQGTDRPGGTQSSHGQGNSARDERAGITWAMSLLREIF